MSKITYVVGDATNPIGEDRKVICHVSNDLGGWGSGFVLALSKKWKEPEAMYRTLVERPLGLVQFVKVNDDITVANMIAQHKTGFDKTTGFPPIRYYAVRKCLAIVNDYCQLIGASIHAPRFGAGLAGGNWGEIEHIIEDVITVPMYVYDLPVKEIIDSSGSLS